MLENISKFASAARSSDATIKIHVLPDTPERAVKVPFSNSRTGKSITAVIAGINRKAGWKGERPFKNPLVNSIDNPPT